MSANVAVICAALAGVLGGLATASISELVAWVVGAIAFLVTVAALLAYWTSSLAKLHAAIRPLFPTPRDAFDAPI